LEVPLRRHLLSAGKERPRGRCQWRRQQWRERAPRRPRRRSEAAVPTR
jgi:hypothetical protein